jgi:hypothetical protein
MQSVIPQRDFLLLAIKKHKSRGISPCFFFSGSLTFKNQKEGFGKITKTNVRKTRTIVA